MVGSGTRSHDRRDNLRDVIGSQFAFPCYSPPTWWSYTGYHVLRRRTVDPRSWNIRYLGLDTVVDLFAANDSDDMSNNSEICVKSSVLEHEFEVIFVTSDSRLLEHHGNYNLSV